LIEINFQTAHAPTFPTTLSSGHRDALRNLTLDTFSFSQLQSFLSSICFSPVAPRLTLSIVQALAP